MKKFVCFIFLILITAVLASAADGTPSPTPGPTAIRTICPCVHRIDGYVKNSVTNEPLEGAAIDYYDAIINRGYQTSTDSSGFYQVNAMADCGVDITVTVYKPGFVSDTYYYNGTCGEQHVDFYLDPDTVQTPVPTPTPTQTPTPTPATGDCTCDAGCNSITKISIPFTQSGVGEYCWEAASLGSYINSWCLTKLKINGIDYTNRWVPVSSIPLINGTYYIYYVGNYRWSHFMAR